MIFGIPTTDELAASLVAANPDVLIGVGPYPAHSLRDATRSIPIVLAAVADPVGRGLVASLARPGGNITGVSQVVADAGTGVFEKNAELLKELVPHAERFAVLVNPANPLTQRILSLWSGRYGLPNTSATPPERGVLKLHQLALTISVVEARTVDDIAPAIETAARSQAQALIIGAESRVRDGGGDYSGAGGKAQLPGSPSLRPGRSGGWAGLVRHGFRSCVSAER